jgi:hypothetical protein
MDKIQGHLASCVTLGFMTAYNGKPKKVRRVVAITNWGEAWGILKFDCAIKLY